MDGQVYVRVKAGTSTYSTGTIGSGEIHGGTIRWTYTGGISNKYGWTGLGPNSVTITPDYDSVENTNSMVYNAFVGASGDDIAKIGNCYMFG